MPAVVYAAFACVYCMMHTGDLALLQAKAINGEDEGVEYRTWRSLWATVSRVVPGRGPRHDEEQPLIPEEAHNSQVRHIAWQSEKPSPCSFAQVYQRHRWYLLVRLLGNAGNSKAEQEQLCF